MTPPKMICEYHFKEIRRIVDKNKATPELIELCNHYDALIELATNAAKYNTLCQQRNLTYFKLLNLGLFITLLVAFFFLNF